MIRGPPHEKPGTSKYYVRMERRFRHGKRKEWMKVTDKSGQLSWEGKKGGGKRYSRELVRMGAPRGEGLRSCFIGKDLTLFPRTTRWRTGFGLSIKKCFPCFSFCPP